MATVAYVFLDETLHTKKKGGSQREQEGASGQSDSSHVSCNSDIEMMTQDGEEVETANSDAELGGTSDLIAESDIDSQSDYEVVSAESSDVELLLRVPEHKKHRRRRLLNRVRNYAPSKVAVRAKERAHHYRKQCISCATWCTHCKEECTPRSTRSFVVGKVKAGVAKLKMMLLLMLDRRVLLSTMLYGVIACITIISNEVCKSRATVHASDAVVQKAVHYCTPCMRYLYHRKHNNYVEHMSAVVQSMCPGNL